LKIEQAYEKYKHLDALLSDTGLMVHDFTTNICHELWQAIKADVKKKRGRKEEE
jgi:hypothetical protein